MLLHIKVLDYTHFIYNHRFKLGDFIDFRSDLALFWIVGRRYVYALGCKFTGTEKGSDFALAWVWN
jgi:hypothetical protein